MNPDPKNEDRERRETAVRDIRPARPLSYKDRQMKPSDRDTREPVRSPGYVTR